MVNKAIVVGRLTRDPELKETSSSKVCSFSIATNEKWTDKSGEKHERVEFHRIIAWGRLAEICAEYLRKGSTAFVEGKLRTHEYEKDGVKRFSTEIQADEVKFLDSAGSQKPQESGSGFNPGMFG
jgi:single-strand DNA-binding protein